MLVLSRKATKDNDVIVADLDGQKVVFKVLSVKGGVVKIGLDAPSEVTIKRGEICLVADLQNRKESKEDGTE